MAAETPRQTMLAAVQEAIASHFTGSLSFENDSSRLYFLFGKPAHTVVRGITPTPSGVGAFKALVLRHPGQVVVHRHNADRTPGSDLADLDPTELLEVLASVPAQPAEPKPSGLVPSPPPPTTTSPPAPAPPVVHAPTAPAPPVVHAPRASAPPPSPMGQTSQRLPLLPLGKLIFENLALAALNLDVLVTTIEAGIITVTAGTKRGIVLVLANRPYKILYQDDDALYWDDQAMQRLQRLSGATASAHALSDDLIGMIPNLINTPPVYQDLQLEWVSWPDLLAELQRRPGEGVVELKTPSGEGVLLLNVGEEGSTLAYTDTHLTPGPIELLNPLLAGKVGSILVRHTSPPAPRVGATPKRHLAPENWASLAEATGLGEVVPQPMRPVPVPAVAPIAESSQPVVGHPDFAIEVEPALDDADSWADLLRPEDETEDFPLEALKAAAREIIGPFAIRFDSLLAKAKVEKWSGEQLQTAVESTAFRGITTDKKALLAISLRKVLDEA